MMAVSIPSIDKSALRSISSGEKLISEAAAQVAREGVDASGDAAVKTTLGTIAIKAGVALTKVSSALEKSVLSILA